MKIFFHRNFKKQFKKLKDGEKRKFREKIKLFVNNPFNPILNNHQLHGKRKDYRSINVTGDLRAVFKSIGNDAAIFIAIDSHSNLYL
ncbi:MAG: Plasmid stabilization system [Parcubacteria group bacterium GW2011_GWC2_42_13]|nr:MAG: Plasmid stabilization system [Parcubacteria group bacterium GW2011_GWC2_42_13]